MACNNHVLNNVSHLISTFTVLFIASFVHLNFSKELLLSILYLSFIYHLKLLFPAMQSLKSVAKMSIIKHVWANCKVPLWDWTNTYSPGSVHLFGFGFGFLKIFGLGLWFGPFKNFVFWLGFGFGPYKTCGFGFGFEFGHFKNFGFGFGYILV